MDAKFMTLENLIKEVVPTSRFSKFAVEQMANEKLKTGENFFFIIDNTLYQVDHASIVEYFAPSIPPPEVKEGGASSWPRITPLDSEAHLTGKTHSLPRIAPLDSKAYPTGITEEAENGKETPKRGRPKKSEGSL